MAIMGFPDLPPSLQMGIWKQWWVSFRTYLLTNFFTQGDVTIITSGKGPVVTSPNGHRWRITVSNAGTISVTDLGMP